MSKNLFLSPNVTVTGFPWCKGESKTIGIESITAKILCQEHNTLLSPLDSAAGLAFEALREQTRLANERSKFPPNTAFKVERFKINACLLERWLLKTLLNFSYGSSLFIGPNGTASGKPPDDLVNICYGHQKFADGAGMYVAANSGMSLNMVDTVAFSPLVKDEQRILGGFFEFRGIRLFLALMPEGLTHSLASIPNVDASWMHAQLLRPFEKIKAKHGKRISHVVEFQW